MLAIPSRSTFDPQVCLSLAAAEKVVASNQLRLLQDPKQPTILRRVIASVTSRLQLTLLCLQQRVILIAFYMRSTPS